MIALAHADTSARDAALPYVREAGAGAIDAVVPHPAVFGAHAVLTAYYGYSNEGASRLLGNFLDARRIHWRDGLSEGAVRGGLARAGEANVGGWDGCYAQVAIEAGVETVATVDDDVERFDAFDTEIVLSAEEFEELNRFIDG